MPERVRVEEGGEVIAEIGSLLVLNKTTQSNDERGSYIGFLSVTPLRSRVPCQRVQTLTLIGIIVFYQGGP